MLKDPSFSLIDVPSKLKELRRCWPHVTTVAGRVVVSTPPVPFCPISTLSTDATTVQLIRPRDVVRVLMGNPEISRFATAEQLMPRELSGGAVELFAHTLGWAKGPFSSWNISDRYFRDAGLPDRLEYGSFIKFVDLPTGQLNLGRVIGMYVNVEQNALFVLLELHAPYNQQVRNEGGVEIVESTEWCVLLNDPASFPASVLVAGGLEVLDSNGLAANQINASFSSTKCCPSCGDWGADDRDATDGPESGADLWTCRSCNTTSDVPRLGSYDEPAPLKFELPNGVQPSDVIVLPIDVGGDEYTMFRTTGENVDTYPLQLLCLPRSSADRVNNSVPWIAFSSATAPRERLAVIAHALADLEKGCWVWHAHLNTYKFVIGSIALVGSDMAAGAGFAGTLSAARANYPSRQSLLHRDQMLRPDQIKLAQPRSRAQEEAARAAASMRVRSAKAKDLSLVGLQQDHSPLLVLRSMYNLSHQVVLCSLHVWKEGIFQFLLVATLESLTDEARALFLAGLRSKELFPIAAPTARLCDLDVGDGKSGKVVRARGHKLNGDDVDVLVPGIGLVVELVLRRRDALQDDVQGDWCNKRDQYVDFWRLQCNDLTPTASQMLLRVWRAFHKAYGGSNSLYSNSDWELNVASACDGFLDIIDRSPLAPSFGNKPKTMAVVELAQQRAQFGPAGSFSMDRVEATHPYSRRTHTNHASPDAFVVARAWELMFLRHLVEFGRFGVFDIQLDPATMRPCELPAARVPGFAISPALSALLRRVFHKGLPHYIASFQQQASEPEAHWVSKRKIPRVLVGTVGKLAGFVRGPPFQVPALTGSVLGLELSAVLGANGKALRQHKVVVVQFNSLELGRPELRPAQQHCVVMPGLVVVLRGGAAFRVQSICGCRLPAGQTCVFFIGAKLEEVAPDPRALFAHLDAFRVLPGSWLLDPLLIYSLHHSIRACTQCLLTAAGQIAHAPSCSTSRIRLLDAWVPKQSQEDGQ
jgi:hypothetical protein